MKKAGKKNAYIPRVLMMVLTTVLIGVIVAIMLVVGQIQGTARVVNYAGLVRGETQRIIKLENAGLPQDGMIDDVTSFIAGLRFGSNELQLVRLNDVNFQNKMAELSDEFETLKKEIQLVRTVGYHQTDIIQQSEDFFAICDEATGLAGGLLPAPCHNFELPRKCSRSGHRCPGGADCPGTFPRAAVCGPEPCTANQGLQR
ncbi:hypothetical protein [uncultured Gemmiger sp.]|uniref:hypothetical protein n=1 Tax=uncultured Gemmiger sp. TaxID=1623490 RepID=UPI00261A2273|nr:hypothetical protein [uncultured Gemmiger sp.]